MCPLSVPESTLLTAVTHPHMQKGEPISSSLETPTPSIDRKAKKRIQNRVAQRTYRTRIKQRLHDLQQQVQTLQQKEEQQRDPQTHETEVNDSENEGEMVYSPFSATLSPLPVCMEGSQRPNFQVTGAEVIGEKSTASGSWTGIPSQYNMWSAQFGAASFDYDDSFHLPAGPAVDLTAGATISNLSSTDHPQAIRASAPYSHACHTTGPINALTSSHGADGHSRQWTLNPTANHFQIDKERCGSNTKGYDSPYSYLYGSQPEQTLPAYNSKSTAATKQAAPTPQPHIYQSVITPAPLATVSTPWGNGSPNPTRTVEERFEYALRCAQSVGFDSFDAMALQYYTQNFDPASPLALEQRLSRNRRLPELLSELRKQSTTWGVWQYRGYQDEILKTAEQIFTSECNEFRRYFSIGNENESVDVSALGDMLPNFWTLLTGLASSNPKLAQRQISEAVIASMRLLCGLGLPQDLSGVSSSRPSSR
jgi:hypothetical protein